MTGRLFALAAAAVAAVMFFGSMAPTTEASRGGLPGRPSPKPSPSATVGPTPTATAVPTATPTASPSPAPTASPSPAPTSSPSPTASPTPAPSRLEGLDVSVWQGTINWSSVKAAGKKFAMVRASAGSLTSDTQYAANRAGAKSAGIPISAYHYANPDTATNDALNEANWFLQNATPTHGDLIPALDVEVTNGLSVSQMQTWVSTWLTRVSSVLGVKPMIYSSPSFWSTSLGNTQMFAQQGYTVLWIAHWTTASSPTVPAGNWGGYGWTFWQYTSSGTVPGISGNVDLDRYNGSALASSLFIP
jgi:lysozyme